MTFDKTNYMLMAAGVVLIALGLVLLSGGGSSDPEVFSDSIFNFRRMVLAPIVMLAGFGIEFYAIMKKPKQKEEQE